MKSTILNSDYQQCSLLTHSAFVTGAYGATKRYKSVQRVHKVNDTTIIGASGEISDFQYLQDLLDQLVKDDYCADDGVQLDAHEIFAWLTRVLYNRRNKCGLYSSVRPSLPRSHLCAHCRQSKTFQGE